MRHPLQSLLFILVLFSCGTGWAAPLDVAVPRTEPIGASVQYLKEPAAPLSLAQARRAFAAGSYETSSRAFLSFGIGSRPVWLRFQVVNHSARPVMQRLSLDTSWLDEVDIHEMRDGQTLASHRLGDTRPYAERPVGGRYHAVDLLFPPGLSSVYLRVASVDPMVLPIYLSTVEQAQARLLPEHYSYGFLYGGIFSLLAYNLMLFFSLKSRRYLFYTLYLAAFAMMNIAYTGHGYHYLWPDAPRWQQWSNPVLMMAFQLAGFLFATTFLNTRIDFPRQNRVVIALCSLFAGAELAAVLLDSQLVALLLSFGFTFVFSSGILLLGALTLRAGNKSAKYFLVASISHATTTAAAAATVWGLVPYSVIGYRALEVGMLLDAILLAMALADQFRINQSQKILAERLAKMDPLTEMNNRRAFYELAQPCWNNGLRRQHAISVILLDIDRFKVINDSHGHALGDEVLRAVARVLREGARDSDILARWGGEEFILLLDETELGGAVNIAERLRHVISELRLATNGEVLAVTASFGVAHAQPAVGSLDELIGRADKHLYMAKELGRNRVCSKGLEAVQLQPG